MAGSRDTGGTVVLVDDDPAVLEAMSETLVLEGYVVRAHGEPLGALAGLDSRFAGVVISDLRMPEMDGLELMARVHGIDPAIPFILVTGHGDVPRAVEAMRSGAFDFLEKPADPDYLIALAANALRLRWSSTTGACAANARRIARSPAFLSASRGRWRSCATRCWRWRPPMSTR